MAVNLFSYQTGSSILHKMNALLKVLLLTLFCIFIFLEPPAILGEKASQIFLWTRTAICVFIPVLLFLLSAQKIKIVFFLWPVLLTGAFVTVFRSFDFETFSFSKQGFFSGCIYALNFFMASLASVLVFKTTSSIQIRESLLCVEDALAKVFPFVKKLNLALALSLTINFLPSVFEYWNKARLACKARSGNVKMRFFSMRIFCAQFSAMFSCLLYRAETTRRAVINRT